MEYMQQIISNINEHQGAIIDIITVLGFIFALYCYYKKHGYKLGYLQDSSLPLLIDYEIKKDLKIIYKGKPITRLKGKTFRIFNYGDKEIRKEDLYENKLSIIAVNGKILDITIQIKEDDGNIKLKKVSDTKYNINFSYINISQIIDVKILYDAEDVLISCKAAGMENIRKFSERIKPTGFIYMPFIFLFVFLTLYSYYLKDWSSSFIYPMSFFIFTLLALIIICMYIYQIYAFWIGPKQKIIDYKFPNTEN